MSSGSSRRLAMFPSSSAPSGGSRNGPPARFPSVDGDRPWNSLGNCGFPMIVQHCSTAFKITSQPPASQRSHKATFFEILKNRFEDPFSWRKRDRKLRKLFQPFPTVPFTSSTAFIINRRHSKVMLMSCAGGSSQGSWLVLGLPSFYELVIWLVVERTPLKNDGVKVSSDDDIPNWMESHKIHVQSPPTSLSL